MKYYIYHNVIRYQQDTGDLTYHAESEKVINSKKRISTIAKETCKHEPRNFRWGMYDGNTFISKFKAMKIGNNYLL